MIVDYTLEELAEALEALCETLAVGTDGTATGSSDTALKAEEGTITPTVTRDGAVVTVNGVWTNDTGATKTIREYGILDASDNLITRIAINDAEGGSGIEREVPDDEDLTIDAWVLTVE